MKNNLLHSTSSGEGQTIVLLHGYLASSHYFSRMVPRLARSFHVISLDLLGFGQSPKPRSEHTYESQVAAVQATLDHLDVHKPFILLGHSMGALIAARYANTHAEAVSSLQLFNPPLYLDRQQAMSTLTSTGRHYRAMITSPLRPLYWQSLKLSPTSKSMKRPPINFTDTIRMSRHAREGMMHNVIAAPELFDDLQKLTQPTLLVVGKYDRVVYQANLKSISLPSNITLELLETGHHPIVKNAELAEKLIRQHII